MFNKHHSNLLVIAVSLMIASPGFAGTTTGGPLPWEGPLQRLLESFTGPVVQAVLVLAVVALGLGMAFSEGGGFLRRSMGVLFGASIAAAAASFVLDFFGVSQGAVV